MNLDVAYSVIVVMSSNIILWYLLLGGGGGAGSFSYGLVMIHTQIQSELPNI